MKLYFGLLCSLALVACGQATPPSLEKTDAKALSEFNKKYQQNEYEKVSILHKQRLEANPSSSDHSLYNVKYNITYQFEYDLSRNLMDRIIKNEQILDPTGLYKNLTKVDRTPLDDMLRKGSDILNVLNSEDATKIHMAHESNTKFIEENQDSAKSVFSNCQPCVKYMSETSNDKDYQSLKEKALSQALVSYIKDGIDKIPPTGFGEEIIVFQMEK